MVLKNHIAYRFLTDTKMSLDICKSLHPEEYMEWSEAARNNLDIEAFINGSDKYTKLRTLLTLIHDGIDETSEGVRNNNMIITESVIKLLDHFKFNKVDWTIFKSLTTTKRTFILPSNEFVRMYRRHHTIQFFYGTTRKVTEGVDFRFTCFYVDVDTGEAHINSGNKETLSIGNKDEVFLFKLMCFIFLSETQEEIVPPGKVHGTRKTGKTLNDLPTPVTIVTSKWNITSVRIDGFMVSGHIRLQPCGTGRNEIRMVLISPYEKHGYVRKAKSESVK